MRRPRTEGYLARSKPLKRARPRTQGPEPSAARPHLGPLVLVGWVHWGEFCLGQPFRFNGTEEVRIRWGLPMKVKIFIDFFKKIFI